MYKYFVLLIFIVTSFNVSAQFKWPVFSNKDDPKHCLLDYLNFEEDIEKKYMEYDGETVCFVVKNYTRFGLGNFTKNSNVVLIQAYDPKTMIHERVVNNKLVRFESTEYELRTGGGYLYNNIIIERQFPKYKEKTDDEIVSE